MKGIINLGNTCYFNAALQCLMHVPIIRSIKYEGDCTFTKMFCDFTRQFWDPNVGRVFNVQPLLVQFQKHFPRFKSFEKHDTQETVLCIIDILEKSVPELKKYFYGNGIEAAKKAI